MRDHTITALNSVFPRHHADVFIILTEIFECRSKAA
jgi:hypothetical protein